MCRVRGDLVQVLLQRNAAYSLFLCIGFVRKPVPTFRSDATKPSLAVMFGGDGFMMPDDFLDDEV